MRRRQAGIECSGADAIMFRQLTIKFIHDQSSTIATDILDLSQFRIGDDLASRVSWIRGKNDARASRDFVCDLLRVDVILVGLGQGHGNGSEALKQAEHLVVSRVVRDEEA